MPISHGHKPYDYGNFVPELESKTLIDAVELKQNLYDQGRGQIQAKIDELAGFDIVRDVDRQYVNQELNKIYSLIDSNSKNKDFSNPQAVRSFLDIAKPLEKDGIFKNAKESTAELRKRQGTLEYMRTKKPELYSAANEWDYMRDVQKWASDPNAGAVLTQKQYTPYKDVSKKIMNIVSKVKADSLTTMGLDKTGRYLSKTEIEEITAFKIKQAVMSSLTADEQNQLRIDSDFTIKDLSFEEKYSKLYDFYSSEIKINNQLSTFENNETGLTPEQHRLKAQAAADILNKINNSQDTEYLDRIYSNLYISDFTEGIGKAYSYKSYKNTYEADPFAIENVRSRNALNNAVTLQKLKGQQEIQQMLLEGKAMIDASGNVVHNPNYKAPTTAADKENQFSLFDSKSEDFKGVDSKLVESAIEKGEYSGEHTYESLSPSFQYKIKQILKSRGVTGDDLDNIGKIEFKPYRFDVGANEFDQGFEDVNTTQLVVYNSDGDEISLNPITQNVMGQEKSVNSPLLLFDLFDDSQEND